MSEPIQAGSRYTVADSAVRGWGERLTSWEAILAVLLVAVFAVNALLSPYFLDLFNLSDATFNFSEKALVALPMAMLVLVREIDLSVAATIALASLAMGLCAEAGAGTPVLIAVGLGVGLACGTINGLLVTAVGLPSIVVTIGTMSLYRGIAQVVLGDQAVTKYPPGLGAIGQGYLIDMPPVPLSFALFLAAAAVAAVVLHRTALGRQLYAVGNNPVAARFSGVPVDRIRLGLFAVTGLVAGLAAILLTGRIGSTRPNIATGWELEIVTMVVLGGVSIAGGAGTIGGVVLAVFVLGFATFGLSLVNVPGIVINILLGVLLVAAIAVPVVAGRLMGRAPTRE